MRWTTPQPWPCSVVDSAGPIERGSMDQALWVTWYDLPDSDRAAYLAWVHGAYIPKVVERPGVLWGAHYASEENVVPLGGGKGRVSHVKPDSIPGGDRYILIFGAENADVFASPSPRRFHAQLPEGDQAMLALRTGERVNVMLEETRVYGPEARLPESD